MKPTQEIKDTSNAPDLILGSAMWGWTVAESTCFRLLDDFYAAGFRGVDSATNYPINKIPSDFRRSERILQEWIRVHGVKDLRITMKVGSLDNLRSPDCNLSKSFLLFCMESYSALFSENLDTIMIHWDNRDSIAGIADTFSGLKEIVRNGYRVGLSGIRYPELYASQNQSEKLDFSIQIKHNLLHSDYQRYAPFHGERRFFAYGINAGGLKLNPGAYHENSSLKVRGGDVATPPSLLAPLAEFLKNAAPFHTLNDLAMLYAWYHPDMAGLLLGVSGTEQLKDSLNRYETLRQGDFRDYYRQLLILQQEHASTL